MKPKSTTATTKRRRRPHEYEYDSRFYDGTWLDSDYGYPDQEGAGQLPPRR